MRARRTAVVVVGLLLASGLAVLVGGPASADRDRPRTPTTSSRELNRDGETARIVSDAFVIGRPYRGDFPDPSVLRVGADYYAYSTSAAGRNLPIMRSRDLAHWYPNRKQRSGWYNEGLTQLPRWAKTHRQGRHQVGTVWAPSVVRLGPHRYLLAYATRYRTRRHKMCISTARATRPTGPFRDTSRRPLVCPGAYGAIDPQFVRGTGGTLTLVWKTEQSHVRPTTLISWRLRKNARGFKPTGPRAPVLAPSLSWEQALVENPSMLRYRGRYYLFYSAGPWSGPHYVTGYAVCSRLNGPCVRRSTAPLLHTKGAVSGPGGAMAFVDKHGRLRLAYAAWDRGAYGYQGNPSCVRQSTGCHQRRLHIATLTAAADGRLSVASYG